MSKLVSPAIGQITSRFGPRKAPKPGASTNHKGTDIARGGTNIFAPAAGRIVANRYNSVRGNLVDIDHGAGVVTRHQHLRARSPLKVGARVEAGTLIGTMGATGNVTGVHLHTEVIINGTHVNPETWYAERGVKLGTNQVGVFGQLAVTGIWDEATTKAMQEALGTKPDGVISRQRKGTHNQAVASAQFVRTLFTGSALIKELQRRLKKRGLYSGKIDGLLGPLTILGLQKYLGTIADAIISSPSQMVRALQTALNEGKFKP